MDQPPALMRRMKTAMMVYEAVREFNLIQKNKPEAMAEWTKTRAELWQTYLEVRKLRNDHK